MSLKQCVPSSVKNVRCMVCGADKARILYIYQPPGMNERCDLVQCEMCGHMTIDPFPLKTIEARSMNTIGDAELFHSPLLKLLYEYGILHKEIRAVQKLTSDPHRSLLDIGCGTGWTTSVWQKEGFRVTGLELSEARAAVCREKYGIPVLNKPIEELDANVKYDVILIRHVLEHIGDPVIVLTKVRSLLNENGVLLITIPNINSIGRYTFKESWEWILPWHLHFYSPATLKRLVLKLGFHPLRLYQMPSPLWYPVSLKRWGEGHRGFGWIQKVPNVVLLPFLMPLILTGCLLSLNDNMTLICRRGEV